ncbi:TPA: hypothetical protein ACNHC7_003878, partial [Escherichia coli]
SWLQPCLLKIYSHMVTFWGNYEGISQYKGLLKNDNQLAMLFTLANLFRVDQMIRQWERSQ